MGDQLKEMQQAYDRLGPDDDLARNANLAAQNSMKEKRSKVLGSIFKTIVRGSTKSRAWRQVADSTERLASMRTQETVRQQRANLVWTIPQIMAFADAVQQAFLDVEDDKEKRSMFALRMATLLGVENIAYAPIQFV